MNIRATLEELGYKLRDSGAFYRTAAIYRGGDNPTALSINKNTGWFVDFAAGKQGPIKTLILLTLGLKDYKEVEGWIEERGGFTNTSSKVKPKVSLKKHYPESSLSKLLPLYDFYLKRGISQETLKTFKGGVAMSGKMNNRFVFPIYDETSGIVGFAGRDLLARDIKWKIIGPRRLFVHPFPLSAGEVEKKGEIVLVESVGDLLALWEAGVRNAMATFGLTMQKGLLNFIVRTRPKRIILSLNNEPEKGGTGGSYASEKITKKLASVFDPGTIETRPPTRNDFGDMSTEEIAEWRRLNAV